MKLNAEGSVNLFTQTVRDNNPKLRARKKRILNDFCQFVEETQQLCPGTWNFDKAIKVVYNEASIYRMPIGTDTVRIYMSIINKQRTPGVYNEILYTLKQFFKYLVTQRILAENPAHEIEPKKVIKKDMSLERLNTNELARLLVAAYEFDEHVTRNFTLVLALLTTATRIGELVKLKEGNIQLEHHLIYAHGKSGHRRRLMTPGLMESFEVILDDPLRKENLQGEKYIFYSHSQKGKPLSTNAANKLLKAFAKNAGIEKNITSYWLRRTFATLLADSGFNIAEIQKIYHHSNVKSTEAYVLAVERKVLKAIVNESPVVNRLEDFIRSKFTVV
ncbi:MAG: tyrosine-type recombinase/integrase [Dethiobacter sp.]|nr:tyrosine-type recombinase/integrase [Dethiobacter sp.]